MINDFKDFDQVKPGELYLERHKLFFPYYELTDGQFVYARINYKNSFKRYAIIKTAAGSWTIKMKGLFKRSLLINNDKGETVGTLVPETWKRDVNLQMDNGFRATYTYKSLFGWSLTLINNEQEDLVHITRNVWNFKRPFVITLSQTRQSGNMPSLLLMALIGINLILIRQAQAAAH